MAKQHRNGITRESLTYFKSRQQSRPYLEETLEIVRAQLVRWRRRRRILDALERHGVIQTSLVLAWGIQKNLELL